MLNNVPMVDVELKQNDLISFMDPMCPHCGSRNVAKNGTWRGHGELYSVP